MLLFAHTGITLGLVYVWDRGLHRPLPPISNNLRGKITGVTRKIDYRLVLIGSMLPDIIDKPIGHLFFNDTFDNNGRLFAHTLLFFLLLFGYGLFRFLRQGKNGFLVLAVCSGFHLVLDSMWGNTRTLFWPLKGWKFPESYVVDTMDWLKELSEAAQTDPPTYVSEGIGITILVIFVYLLWRRKSIGPFIKKGFAG